MLRLAAEPCSPLGTRCHGPIAWSLLHSSWIQMTSTTQDGSGLIPKNLASICTVGGTSSMSSIFLVLSIVITGIQERKVELCYRDIMVYIDGPAFFQLSWKDETWRQKSMLFHHIDRLLLLPLLLRLNSFDSFDTQCVCYIYRGTTGSHWMDFVKGLQIQPFTTLCTLDTFLHIEWFISFLFFFFSAAVPLMMKCATSI